jgi:CBS domain-containing protein
VAGHGHGRLIRNSHITATSDTTVREAAEVMLTNGFRHLPVVEGRELKGMVSIRDVLASGIRRRSNLE